jgi:hypothetical protein
MFTKIMASKKDSHRLDQSRPTTILQLDRPRRIYIIILFTLLIIIYHYRTVCVIMMPDEDPTTDLSQYTQTVFLPYIKKFRSESTPTVNTTINGINIEMPVDTGSTLLLIGAPRVPNIDPTEGIKTYHYLTSSAILYIGRLVDLSVTFHGLLGAEAVARVPALVADESFRCPWYDPKKDTDKCPRGPNGEEATRRDTRQITYMGVGFGRNKPGSGQPNAVPKRNAFLNIVSIKLDDGDTVSLCALRAGYIISSEGVQLGLTEANTRGFSFAQLEPGVTHREDSRDWAMARANFSINGDPGSIGYGLLDTGIQQMFIRAEDGVSIPTITVPNPNPNGTRKEVERVKSGTEIGINFLSLNETKVAEYSFTVGKHTSKMEPYYVKEGKQTPPPFVNTGRNVLFGYSIAFDAVGGRFGFRQRNDIRSNPGSLL